jgi:hypothetical protein
MNERVQLFSSPKNFAVVQLPGRKFPGVVFQGDSLYNLTERVNDIRNIVLGFQNEEVDGCLLEVYESLTEVLSHYEKVCKERGISLPYVKENIQ